MKNKITKRDVTFFILGVVTFLIISFVYDWNNNVQSVKDGYNDARKVEAGN